MVAQVDGNYFRTSPTKSLARFFTYVFIEGRPLTTKGRWINPFVFAQYSIIKKLPQLKQVRQPFYIMGTGRSGSTFLGNALSLHPDVCYLNEPKALWHSVFPYEDVLGNYTDLSARFCIGADDATGEVIKKARKLYAYALACTVSSRILDKHGELIFRAAFIKKIFPDARFIFLVRNGNDTVASVARWSESKGSVSASGKSDWWGANNRKWNLLVEELVASDDDLGPYIDAIKKIDSQVDMAAVEWILTIKEGQRMLKLYPESSMLVRYEDFLQKPDRTLDDIFEFVNLEKSDRVKKYAYENMKLPYKRDEFKLMSVIEDAFLKTLSSMGY